MVEEALVESKILDSISLVKALDAHDASPSNVVWHFFPDLGAWRLLVGGPLFDSLLPERQMQAYEKIADAMASLKLDTLSIGEIEIVKTDDPLLVAARFLIRTPPSGFCRAHFKNNYVNGVFLQEMLVLRASAPQSHRAAQ